ncbi:MAG: hypothetical protein Q7S22_06210, partial [Candidatus Micrarchaeota archaeon]|nr:hypothetical protein [Candidatus Micrarchaeota archaeon]
MIRKTINLRPTEISRLSTRHRLLEETIKRKDIKQIRKTQLRKLLKEEIHHSNDVVTPFVLAHPKLLPELVKLLGDRNLIVAYGANIVLGNIAPTVD